MAPRNTISPAFDNHPKLKVLPTTGIWNFVTSVDFSRALMSGHILLEIRMKKMMKPYTLQALKVLASPNRCFSTCTVSFSAS